MGMEVEVEIVLFARRSGAGPANPRIIHQLGVVGKCFREHSVSSYAESDSLRKTLKVVSKNAGIKLVAHELNVWGGRIKARFDLSQQQPSIRRNLNIFETS